MGRIADFRRFVGDLIRDDILIPVDSASWSLPAVLTGKQIYDLCKGADGKQIQVQSNGTHIQWRYVGDSSWTNMVQLSTLKGADGKEVELRASGGYIQMRLTGGSWLNLIALEELRGPDGTPAPLPNFTFQTTTLPAGSDATVSYGGIYPNISITFGVPRGADAPWPAFSFSAEQLAPGATPTVTPEGAYPNISLKFGIPVGQPAAEPNFTLSAEKLAPGANPTVTKEGAYPNLNMKFGIPEGQPAPLPVFGIVMATLAENAEPTYSITGAYPNLTINLGVPKGKDAVLPVFGLSITALEYGTPPTSSITGAYPNLTINLGIPQGKDAELPVLTFSAEEKEPGTVPEVIPSGDYPNIHLQFRIPKGLTGATGRPLVVLGNGNYGNWDNSLNQYVDSGVAASASPLLDEVRVIFEATDVRNNIQSNETVTVLFSKIKRWLLDLKSLAFKDKVNYTTDIENLPSIPSKTSDLTNDSDFASVTYVNETIADEVSDAIAEHDADEDAHEDIRTAIGNKVDKEDGKGLSTEDYTEEEKSKLDGIETGAQVNTVASVAGKTGAVTLNSSDVGLAAVTNDAQLKESDKVTNVRDVETATDIAIATEKAVAIGLSLKSDKETTYTKTEVRELVDEVKSATYHFVGYVNTEAPSGNGLKVGDLWYEGVTLPLETFTVYTYTSDGWSENMTNYTHVMFDLWANQLDTHGYYWFNNEWNKIDQNVDLSIYRTALQQDEIDAEKVDKIPGKGLSTEDFTSDEKEKLSGITAGATLNLPGAEDPSAPGVANPGSAEAFSREDHVHPAQTDVTGNAGTATKLLCARTLNISGTATEEVGGIDGVEVEFDGSGNVVVQATVPAVTEEAAGVMTPEYKLKVDTLWLGGGGSSGGGALPPESVGMYGIEWDTTMSATKMNRIGNLDLHRALPIQNGMRGCLMSDGGLIMDYLPANSWLGADRSGASGQVMVEIPAHYRKCETEGTIQRVKISEYPLVGYQFVPKSYMGAYKGAVDRALLKLCSIVNLDPNFRGGNNNAAWDATYRTLCGKPATAISCIDFQTYARNRGQLWNALVYNVYKSVFWLYYTEYADRNCQLPFNAQKDGNGFAQGGLGDGVSTLNGTQWSNFNSYYPITPCGHTDLFGNRSGEVAFTDANLPVTLYVPRYRGLENPFSELREWAVGINVQGDGTKSTIYVCDEPALFSSTSNANYHAVGESAASGGYIKELLFGEGGEILPLTNGGGSTTYWPDYGYVGAATNLRAVLFGGGAYEGAFAGFGSSSSYDAPSGSHSGYGSRLCFLPSLT
jgi:hypothetical protein